MQVEEDGGGVERCEAFSGEMSFSVHAVSDTAVLAEVERSAHHLGA